MNRGEVRWHTFDPPDQRRPVVILTRQPALSFLTDVTVAPLTTRIRGIPSEVLVEPTDSLSQPSAISLDNVTTMVAAELGPIVATLEEPVMRAVEDALAFSLGFHRRLGD